MYYIKQCFIFIDFRDATRIILCYVLFGLLVVLGQVLHILVKTSKRPRYVHVTEFMVFIFTFAVLKPVH